MKLKIVNKRKFVRSLVIISSIVLVVIFAIGNKTLSHGETHYISIYVKQGDTLWSIAETLQRENPYYDGKDVRYIINSIKSLNKLSSSSLMEGQELLIANL